jgi:thioredoxin 1
MAGANIQTFTDANFDAEVIKSNVPVLVDFWAEWCMPCRMLTPTIEALGEQFAGKAKIGKVDTDANRKISVQNHLTILATALLFPAEITEQGNGYSEIQKTKFLVEFVPV